jgi:hypothetical protein
VTSNASRFYGIIDPTVINLKSDRQIARKTLPLCNALSGELGIAVIAGSHIVTRRGSAQQVNRDLGLTIVCDPRRNALLKEGNKSDRIDARKLAELLYLDKLRPVYHGEHGARTLKGAPFLALDTAV